jgi:hypothetical protein
MTPGVAMVPNFGIPVSENYKKTKGRNDGRQILAGYH